MELMSEPLRNDVRSFLMENTLDQIPFFADLDSVAISKLFTLLKPLKVQQARYLYHSGSAGDEMFILIKGKMQEVVHRTSADLFDDRPGNANRDNEDNVVVLQEIEPVELVGACGRARCDGLGGAGLLGRSQEHGGRGGEEAEGQKLRPSNDQLCTPTLMLWCCSRP